MTINRIDLQSVKPEFGQSGVTCRSCLKHSKRRCGFGVRFMKQHIPFSKEKLLTEEEESRVPGDEILTPIDHSLELQKPLRELKISESRSPGNSADGGRIPSKPQAVPMDGGGGVTVNQLCPWTAFTIKLRIQGAQLRLW